MKNISIFENGIYMQFSVNEKEELLLYNFSSKEATAPETFKDEEKVLAAVEVQLAGAGNTVFKHIGHLCPEVPKYRSHTDTQNKLGRLVVFTLSTTALEIKQYYQFYSGIKTVAAYTEVKNLSSDDVALEYLTSFAYGGFTDNIHSVVDTTEIFFPHNSWCEELNWRKQSLREAGFNTKSLHNSTKRIYISNKGTWSTKEYLPMGLLYDTVKGERYFWQIESSGSWLWELGDLRQKMYLRLSGPTEQEHNWCKKLSFGESFISVPVAVTVTSEGFDDAVSEMTKYRRKIVDQDRLDPDLPIVFNDYMDCLWANPTSENVSPMIEKAAELGAEIYCMDAGWYSMGDWWPLVGEWKICEERFSQGIDKLFEQIKKSGMRAGIWLEPEVMGANCPLVPEFEDCFFKYRGKNIIANGRYQLDFRKEKVINHLNKVVDNLIERLGVSYFKFDYNIDPIHGNETDADSSGDGQLECSKAYLNWIDSLYKRHPGLIIENCASGGMRMEYSSLRHHAIQSVSDATHFGEFAHMSAMAPTAVIPEQTGIWVVTTNNNTPGQNKIAAVNGMLNRMYFSGRVDLLREEDFSSLKESIAIYKTFRKELVNSLPIFPDGVCNCESDWMVGGRITADNSTVYLSVVHMRGEGDKKELAMACLESAGYTAEVLYPSGSGEIALTGSKLTVTLESGNGLLIRLKKTGEI